MTGDGVRSLRQDLGIDRSGFAQLLGVHSSTVHRWEAVGSAAARIDPCQRRILALLERHAPTFVGGAAALGSDLRKALLARGPMFALYRLLDLEFADFPRRRLAGER